MSFIHGKTKDGGCGGRHETVAEARACNEGRLFECGWLVLRTGVDFDYMEYTYETECGATAISTDEGWSCAAGHSHTYAEVMAQRNEVYVDDPGEAYVIQHFHPEIKTIRMDGRGVETPERPTHFAY